MNFKNKPFLFFLFWLLISLVQAACTRLTSDEGYYWFYTQHLQWGYYDHPPLTALMIKLGYSVFQNELGVRLLNVLVTSASFLLLFKLIPENLRQKNFTFLVLLSQPLLHYFSIIVFPDGPLLFFSLLFLLGYKRLTEKNDAQSALLLGLSLAGMFYSKYHGVLVLVFTVLSNFSLLKSKWFWLSLLIPFALAIPHVWWQYENGFPTLQYHLQGRVSGFSLKFVGEYISQQIPAIGPLFLIAAFAWRRQNQFEKTLKFIAIGTITFFLFTSFRGFVHFHWTSVALFPMVLLAVNYYQERKKLFYWLAIPFLIVIVLFRIHIVYPFLPFKQRDAGYYHNRDLWAKDVAQLAGGRPVLFIQDFREAGLYTFYTHQMAVALFGGDKRKTQYDLWHYEDSLQGKDVLMIQKRNFPGCSELQSRLGKTVYYQPRPHFESYYSIPVKVKLSELAKDSLEIEIVNNRTTALLFPAGSSGNQPVLFYQVKNNAGEIVKTDTLKVFSEKDKIAVGAAAVYHFSFPVHELGDGKYNIEIGFLLDVLPPSFNSAEKKFIIRRNEK
ncbi:MAG: hypothetical protein EPN92_02005 [Chitinophagaceae bacterium]|nr:MAG: hypothetical protein EPN92_02005 [Chitinophagaceae bacterium]